MHMEQFEEVILLALFIGLLFAFFFGQRLRRAEPVSSVPQSHANSLLNIGNLINQHQQTAAAQQAAAANLMGQGQGYGGYPNQGYPNAGYPGQGGGYPSQGGGYP